MPIKNLEITQKQTRLFQTEFRTQLNSKNKLYKLREVIDWANLKKEL